MSLRRTLLILIALATLAPGTASAGDVRVLARDEPLGVLSSSVARRAPLAFTMVGIHWRGPGAVWFRIADERGRFGPWRPARDRKSVV